MYVSDVKFQRPKASHRCKSRRPIFVRVLNVEPKKNLVKKKSETPIDPNVAKLMPGLENILNQRNSVSVRLFWALTIVLAFITCSYQICNRVYIYATQETVFQTKVEVNSTVSLPVVTLCLNGVHGSADLKRTYAKEHNLSDFCQVTWTDLIGYKGMDLNDIWNLNNITYYIHPELIFPKAKLVNSKRTVIKRKSTPTLLGFCESLDLTENLVIYEYGIITYFRITLMGDEKDNPCGYQQVNLKIHSPYESIRHEISRESFIINKGIYMDVILTYKKIVFDSSLGNSCTAHDVYNRCVDDCFDKKITDGLTCRLPFMNSTLPLCKDRRSAEKAYNKSVKVYEDGDSCRHCPKRCIQDRYTVILTPFDTKKEGVKLGLYYQDKVFVTATEVTAYDFISCLSEIGGNLGLFLGFSLLHLVDIITSFISRLSSKLLRKCHFSPSR